jgi:Rrf2 family protein
MLKLSKRSEYALLAMFEMARDPSAVQSAKGIADRYSISPSLVAKVLQQLVREGVVRSYAGANGGYTLAVGASDISIERVVRAIDGFNGAIVDCQESAHHECSAHGACTIREPLTILQDRINATFRSMTVAELVSPQKLIQLEVS